MKKKIALIILDGFGISTTFKGNAIAIAETPFLEQISNKYLGALIKSSGAEVGLAQGEMGNSEVGHLNIGSGRISYQDLIRINKEINSGYFESKNIWNNIINHTSKNNSDIHLIGLVSSGGVHSSIEHIGPIVKSLLKKGFNKKIILHFISDGQDVPPKTASIYFDKLSKDPELSATLIIGTLIGRFFALDKSQNWDRTKKAYDILVNDTSSDISKDFLEALKLSYDKKLDDENIEPTILERGTRIKSNDSVIFFDFRPDRARQLTTSLTDYNFSKFERSPNHPQNLMFVTMTNYGINNEVRSIVDREETVNTLSKVLSDNGIRQLHIAETEKYAHVTYFFNGGVESALPGEERVIIPSPKIDSYANKPEMSAHEITSRVIDDLNKDKNDFYIINYANADMVGHTGNLSAGVKAIEILDTCLKDVVNNFLSKDGIVFITADHGNAEEMINDITGDIDKEHSIFPVPFWIIGSEYEYKGINTLRDYNMTEGILADIAPTILDVIDIKQPAEMTGQSILKYMTLCPLIKKH